MIAQTRLDLQSKQFSSYQRQLGLSTFSRYSIIWEKSKEQKEEKKGKEKRRELKKRGGKNRRGCTKAEFNLK